MFSTCHRTDHALRSARGDSLAHACRAFIVITCLFTVSSQAGIVLPAGRQSLARQQHTATLLSDGKVLVAGGSPDGFSSTNGAEIYDPRDGTSTAVLAMTTARRGHAATLLPSGKVLITGGLNGSSALNSAEIYDPETYSFAPTGFLTTTRGFHAATLLKTGEVLVTGGGTSSSSTSSAEVYNVASGVFRPANPMNAARRHHTAVLLQDGRVLIAGGAASGTGDPSLNSAELYDPTSFTFASVSPMTIQRRGHTATLLGDGRVLVAGGSRLNTSLSSTELWSPATLSFSSSAPLSAPRRDHTASLLPSGKILIAGGENHTASGSGSSWQPLATTDLFNPANSTFAAGPPLTKSRALHTATLSSHGVIIIGGRSGTTGLNTAEFYEPNEGLFSATGPLPSVRSAHTATLLTTGKVLIHGGVNGAAPTVYDPAQGSFSAAGPAATGRMYHSATLLPSGHVLIAGGDSGSGAYLRSAELYDPVTNAFTVTGSLITARRQHTATLLPSGLVLIAGGRGSSGELASAELFNPSTGTFTVAGSLAQKRRSHSATLLPSGLVMVAGGISGEVALDGVEMYDRWTNSFEGGPSLFQGRLDHTATLLSSGQVLIAGGQKDGLALDTVELIDPVSGLTRATGYLRYARYQHTATVLPSGRVMIAAGRDNVAFFESKATVEIYDPASGTFYDADSLLDTRYQHTATLLHSGRVLITGGLNSISGTLATAEVYSSGSVWRPSISSNPAAADQASAIFVSGTWFTGRSAAFEGSGGNTQSSATNYPVLHLRRLDNEEISVLPVDASAGFSSTSFTSSTSWSVNPGPAIATVFTDGIASDSRSLNIRCAVTIADQPSDQVVPIGTAASFTVLARAAQSYEWQKYVAATNAWESIPGATGRTYTTAPITAADSGSRFRVLVRGCELRTSSVVTLSALDSTEPSGAVVSPSGGEYWLLSPSDGPAGTEVVTWSMEDDVRICQVTVSLLYSNDGSIYQAVSSGGLPQTFGPGGNCPYPGETRTSLTYTVPTSFPSGRTGSLYKVRVSVTDHAGNVAELTSENPFYIVSANPDSVKTLILSNVPRMIARQSVSSNDASAVNRKLHELAAHPRVQGLVVDLAAVPSINTLYTAWDADPGSADKANAVLFGSGGIHEHLRTNVLRAYTGVEYLVLVGDDRIIPMARMPDRTVLLLESEYADLSPTETTVGRALAGVQYLTDDPITAADPVPNRDRFDEPPDLAIGRLVETPQEIVTTIATFISQDGILDLSTLDAETGHKVLVTGYDFLSSVARLIRARWKSAFGVDTPDASTQPVDGGFTDGNWGLGSVEQRAAGLLQKLAGNGGTRYGVMALSGHATHYEEGVPGTDPFDIQGLPARSIYGQDCGLPIGSGVDLAGAVIYAVGCHGGLSVPGSCSTDGNNSLDLPQTMLGRGAVAYIANSGFGWALNHGIGYGARIAQIFTEEMTTGGTISVGKAVQITKHRYRSEAPQYDPYDEKSVLQWTLYGLPMYAVRTGIGQGTIDANGTKSSMTNDGEMAGAVRVKRHLLPAAKRAPYGARSAALPSSLTQLNLSFDFSGANVFTKHDADGAVLQPGAGCSHPNGCYYTLNGLVSRGTGSTDLPIQPYLAYDSRLSGTSQHGVLWKGGSYDEDPSWTPVIAQLVSNGGDGSNHGSTPRTVMIRPTGSRVVPGVDPALCRASDLERNTLTVTAGESVRNSNGQYSIFRRYRNVELEVFYFNDRSVTTNNCDRSGPSLGTGPFGGEYHMIAGSIMTWSVPAGDDSGVWRVVVVYNANTVDADSRGTWTPIELTNDGNGTFRGSINTAGATRLTYVIQAVDNRGNITWLDYVSTQTPASGVSHRIPDTVDVNLARPTGLVATAIDPTSVQLTWTAAPGSSIYDVYRSASGTAYAKIGTSPSPAYTDHEVTSGTAYLYAIKALDASGIASGYSNPDLATTVVFTDPVIAPGVTTIKAAHITELRAAVNAVRALAGSGSYPYVDPTITPGVTTAKSAHITDLRTALAAARSDLSLPPAVYSGSAPDVGLPINAAHITELRGATQ